LTSRSLGIYARGLGKAIEVVRTWSPLRTVRSHFASEHDATTWIRLRRT